MATEEQLGVAYVEITARFDKFQRDLNEVKRNTEATARATQASFAKMTAGINGLTSAYHTLRNAAVVTAAVGIFEFIKKTVDATDKLEKMSQKVGIGVEQLQLLHFAARQTGASTEEMDQSLQLFSRTLGDAQAQAGTAREAFNRLGVDYQQNVGTAFDDVRDKLSRVTDASVRNSIANDLFGRSYAAILPVLTLTAAQYANLAAKAKQFGIILSDEVVKKSAATANKLNDLKEVLGVVGQQAALAASGGLAKLADFALKPETLKDIHDLSLFIEQVIELAISGGPKLKAFFDFDPGPALADLKAVADALQHIKDLTADKLVVGVSGLGIDDQILKHNQEELQKVQDKIVGINQQIESAPDRGWLSRSLESDEAFLARLNKELVDAQFQAAVLERSIKNGTVTPSARVAPLAPTNPRGELPVAPFTPGPGKAADSGAAIDKANAAAKQFRSTLDGLQLQIAKLSAGDKFDSYWYDLAEALNQAGIAANETGPKVDEITKAVDRLHRIKGEKVLETAAKDTADIQAETAAITQGSEAYKAYQEARDIKSNVETFTNELTAVGLSTEKIKELTDARRADLEAKQQAQKSADLVVASTAIVKQTKDIKASTAALNAGELAYKAYEQASAIQSNVDTLEAEAKAAGFNAEQIAAMTTARRQDLLAQQDAQEHADVIKAQYDAAQKSQEELRQGVMDFASTFSSAVEDAIVDGKSLQEVFAGLLKDIERLIIRTLILKAVQAGLNAAFGVPGTGNLTAADDTRFALGFHQGGIVGQGGTPRAVNPGIFIGAPRMHKGGFAGIRSGEVPIIAQKGEMILPKGTKMGSTVSQTINVNVNANGGDPMQNRDLAEQTARAVKRAVQSEMGAFVRQQQRPGGQLNPA